MRKFFAPNRIAIYLGTLGAFAAGAAPIVADLKFEDTVGIIAGLAAITAYVDRFVKGQQKQEERDAWEQERDAPEPAVSWPDFAELADRVGSLELGTGVANTQPPQPVPGPNHQIVLNPALWYFDPATGTYRVR